MPNKYRYEEFTWPEIREAVAENRVAVLPVGTVEQHGPHLPLVTDVQGTVRQANADLQRVDGLLERAESISGTVDSASRLAYLAFSNPVVKALAFGAGTSRALKRFRARDEV